MKNKIIILILLLILIIGIGETKNVSVEMTDYDKEFVAVDTETGEILLREIDMEEIINKKVDIIKYKEYKDLKKYREELEP